MGLLTYNGRLLSVNGRLTADPRCCCVRPCSGLYEYYGFVPGGAVPNLEDIIPQPDTITGPDGTVAHLVLFGLWYESEAWNWHYIYQTCTGLGGNSIAFTSASIEDSLSDELSPHWVASSEEALACGEAALDRVDPSVGAYYETVGGSSNVIFIRNELTC